MKNKFLYFILSLTLSLSAFAQDISFGKNQVLESLSSTTAEVDLEALKAVSKRVTVEELDVVFFRLKKEIEKVPEFDLSRSDNTYDLRLIHELMQLVYLKATEDYLDSVRKLRDLAAVKLSDFTLYTELYTYQLDSIILRSKIDMLKKQEERDRRIDFLSRNDLYVNEYIANELGKFNLEKAPTFFLSRCEPHFN